MATAVSVPSMSEDVRRRTLSICSSKSNRSFDPAGVLNPGIKISEASFTEHIDYTRLSKSCATCAKCNSVCPVYDVFQSEDMSSRGWFEIVTAKDYQLLNSKRVVEACLNCKSCRTDLSGRRGRVGPDSEAASRASESG